MLSRVTHSLGLGVLILWGEVCFATLVCLPCGAEFDCTKHKELFS
jgi:hypothetical protein